MPYDLPIPDYLNEDEETIHQRMLQKVPPGISKIEGDFFYDATRPGAVGKAQLVQFTLQNLLMLFFVQTSHGIYLDCLGQPRGVTRLQPTHSTGVVMLIGQPGTIISVGSVVTTQSSIEAPVVSFETIEEATIGGNGEVLLRAMCTEPGTEGNVPAGVITLMTEPIEGVSAVTNPEPLTGGTDEEDDDSLRERVLDAWRLPATSGNKYHYKMWAREVPGVGDAKVFPVWDGPGTVKVVIVDGSKRAASPELIDTVFNHIEEKRPIGAGVTVASAIEKQINITTDVTLAGGHNIPQVKEVFEQAVVEFFKGIALTEGYVSYARLGGILLEIPGVGDYTNLKVNGGTGNVLLGEDETPVLGAVTLEEITDE